MAVCILCTYGCTHVTYSQKAGVDLSKYNSIFIGWLDLSGGDWFELGYSSSEDWQNIIIYINKHFQKYAKDVWYEYMDIPLSFAIDSADKPSTGNDLYIRFDGAKVVDAYFLYTPIQFIDLKNNSILF